MNHDGQIKLADFGIATEVSGDSTGQVATEFVGTLLYMSPERLKGSAQWTLGNLRQRLDGLDRALGGEDVRVVEDVARPAVVVLSRCCVIRNGSVSGCCLALRNSLYRGVLRQECATAERNSLVRGVLNGQGIPTGNGAL